MDVDFSDYQTDEITRVFDDAIDHALASRVDTWGEFCLLAFSYVIWELTERRALRPVITAKYNQLAGRFRQLSLRKEVK